MDPEHVIPASEFTREFWTLQMLAQREAPAVSSHGRVTGYFIAADEYEAFKRFRGYRRSFATRSYAQKLRKHSRYPVLT